MKKLMCKIFGHRWDYLYVNGYGGYSYRECLRCGQPQDLVPLKDIKGDMYDISDNEKWKNCEKIRL